MTYLPFTDPLVSRASGSVGPVVYSRNQHGPYTRARTVPTDPNTSLQVVVRDAMALLTARWRDTLTSLQRRAWDVYALNVSRPGRLARSNNIGGLAQYVRSNVPRIQANEASLPIVDVAPALFDLPVFKLTRLPLLDVGNQLVQVFFDPDEPWANEVGGALLVYVSPSRRTTINFHKGPYRLASVTLGASGSTPQPPTFTPVPSPVSLIDHVFIKARVTTADGRLSSPIRLPADQDLSIPPKPILAEIDTTSPFVVRVFFSQALKPESHSRFNWSVIYNRNIRNVTSVVRRTTLHNTLFIAATPGLFTMLSDRVSYGPPPFDVNGLLNDLPVASFSNFPIT